MNGINKRQSTAVSTTILSEKPTASTNNKSQSNNFQQAFNGTDDNSPNNPTSGIRLNNKNHIANGLNDSHNIFNKNDIGSQQSGGNSTHALNGNIGLNVINKNSLNLLTSVTASSSDNNNKFTPDTDFVADFGSANIFNAAAVAAVTAATVTSANANTAVNNNVTSNGHSNGLSNGKYSNGTKTHNGDEQMNANANFADFDHNPIYDAAGK